MTKRQRAKYNNNNNDKDEQDDDEQFLELPMGIRIFITFRIHLR